MNLSLRRAMQNGALLAASMVFLLATIEVSLRIFKLQGDFFFQLDSEVGATYIPGKKGFYSFPDGVQWVEINSSGFRDREWSSSKEPNTVRIALLGDSYVAGMEVPRRDRMGEVLQEKLNRRSKHQRFEVLNFGVTGFGTAQELETLRHRVLGYEVDIVLCFFYTGNDLFNNSLELDPEPLRLHYRLAEDGDLVRLSYEVRDGPLKQWLRHHSRTYLFVRDSIHRSRALHRAMAAVGLMQVIPVEDKDRSSEGTGRKEPENPVDLQYVSPPLPKIENAWKLSEALLLEMERESVSQGADFAVVLVPTKEESAYSSGESPQNGFDWTATWERFEAICVNNGLSCLNLGFHFRSVKDLDLQYFPKGGHWTASGQELAAQALAAWLEHEFLDGERERRAEGLPIARGETE